MTPPSQVLPRSMGAEAVQPAPAANKAADRRAFAAEVALGSVWGLVLSLYPYCDYFLRPAFVAVGAFSEIKEKATPPMLAVAFVLILCMMGAAAVASATRFGIDLRRSRMFAAIVAPLALLLPLGLYDSASVVMLMPVVLMLYAFVVAIIFASLRVSDTFFTAVLAAAAIGHAGSLIVALADGSSLWGRLTAHAGPNYWGLIATISACCALALRAWWLKLPIIVLSIAVIFMASSRGSMLAVAAAYAVALGIVVMRASTIRRTWILLASASGAIIISLLAGNFLLNDVLKLSDPQRGVSSGGTGRFEAWRETVQLLLEHPFLGVGYRQHERMITAASSAHNAYLATAADLGIFGLLAYLCLTGGATGLAVSRAVHERSRVWLAASAYLSSFMVAGLVERQALNTGNSYSVLMLLIAAAVLRGRSSTT